MPTLTSKSPRTIAKRAVLRKSQSDPFGVIEVKHAEYKKDLQKYLALVQQGRRINVLDDQTGRVLEAWGVKPAKGRNKALAELRALGVDVSK